VACIGKGVWFCGFHKFLLLIFKPTHKVLSPLVRAKGQLFLHASRKEVLHLSCAGKAKGHQKPVQHKKSSQCEPPQKMIYAVVW
jgi:hypothetical protein